MPNDSEFRELGRIRTTDKSEVVLSELHRNGQLQGYSLNKYVTTPEYTGFGKGVFVPDEKLIDFLVLFGAENLEYALDQIPEDSPPESER